ncbi:P-loop containing nucleoside triphosphate hydrolase protein, partial [Mycena rebaudengoi]
IPAPPKLFYGREEEVSFVVNTIVHSSLARIAIVGPDGVGKTAIALVASHDPQVCKLFGQNRFFVDCTPAADGKQLISLIANQLGIRPRRTMIIKHLVAISTAETPVLIVLDAIDKAWTPYEYRSDVEDFLSLLADLEHVALIVTLRGSERPRQVRWTRPLLHTLDPLTSSATRDLFLDISDVAPDDPGLDELLAITENLPGAITRMAGLAAFEGCTSLVARWKKDGPAL